MKTSPQGIAEIAGHEGIVLSPYRDSVGVWTVGVGHTASAGSPNPADLPRGQEQPLAAILDLFRRDLAKFEEGVNRAVKVPLKQHEFDALVSFHFNTGGIARAKLTERLNAGDRAGAAAGFDGWRKPPEIIPRRNKEKALFRDGVYSGGGLANIYPANERGTVQWKQGRRVNVLDLMGGSSPVPPPPDVEPPPPREESGRGAIGRFLRWLLNLIFGAR